MRCVISGPLNSSINDSQLSSSERLQRGTATLMLIDLLNASHTQTRTLCGSGKPIRRSAWNSLPDVTLFKDVQSFLLIKKCFTC